MKVEAGYWRRRDTACLSAEHDVEKSASRARLASTSEYWGPRGKAWRVKLIPNWLFQIRFRGAVDTNAISDVSNTVLCRSNGKSVRALRQLYYAGAGSLLVREMPSFCMRK